MSDFTSAAFETSSSSRGLEGSTAEGMILQTLTMMWVLAQGPNDRPAPVDAWITVQAKLALMTDPALRTRGLQLDTWDGHVTFAGQVRSAQEKAVATVLARAVPGATGVTNLLELAVPLHPLEAQEPDERLLQAVVDVLQADTSLADSRISVASANAGVVVLSGAAKTLSAHLRAVESAAAVHGVTGVVSQVLAPDELTPAESEHLPNGLRDAARDSWTTAEVKFLLLADGAVPALDISVDTHRGVVTLFGQVPSFAAKAAALNDAEAVETSVTVTDDLQVVPSRFRWPESVPDAVLERHVSALLQAEPAFAEVRADVTQGRAHLTGSVATDGERLRAAQSVRGVPGVHAVDDALHLDQALARRPTKSIKSP